MGNKNSAFVDTVGYAIIMVRQFTLMGTIDMFYYINDKKQINRINKIDRVAKNIEIASGKGVVLHFDNREPSETTFLNTSNVLKKGTGSTDEIWFFPTPGAFCKNEGVRYHFVNDILVPKVHR